ncbi:hypothetical protein MTR67_001499 [Solanum verrucosum]|uniref:Uncharacterized protein n=1 Tax=Solanum verrucosum TaxID=315347 RepID=A0AAF0PNC1_SOLVR|nr:hypothetical protein MTR67_001499 [Solanum verrucosum]
MARKRQRNSSQGELLYDFSEQQKQQIGSMSMPQPPQNWPQNERDESHDTKYLLDSEQQKQQIGCMSMPQPPQNWPQNERDESHDTKNLLEGTRLSSKLVVLARNGILAPLNHKDWRLVPSMYKNRIWAHIKENTDATDDLKCIMMMSFGSKWKESKHEAKTIGYDPYEALYGRRCRSPVGWFEVGEFDLLGPEVVYEATGKARLIRDRLKMAHNRQKSYADNRKRDLEFEVGDWVYFKISPMKG